MPERGEPITFDDLVRDHALTRDAADFLGAAMRGGCSVLVTGRAASGKSALLSALGSSLAGTAERVFGVEPAPEIHFNDTIQDYVALFFKRDQAAPPSHEAEFVELVLAAIRMRATRLLIDGIDGPEALHAARALSDGALGGMAATIAADSPSSALTSFVGCALLAAEAPPEQVVHTLVRESIHFVAHVRQRSSGGPLLVSIHETVAPEQGFPGDGISVPAVPALGRAR